MKATIEIELQPFTVPNFVRPAPKQRAKGENVSSDETAAIALSDLSATTLDMMCDDFRREIFKKAGKQQPPTAA